MKKKTILIAVLLISFGFGFYVNANLTHRSDLIINKEKHMKLGAFSISLAVKDIHASKKFYETLGFETLGGDINQKWLILKNSNAIIGLFEGMFDKNIITFNPGWDENAKNTDTFDDVRTIQKHLKNNGISLSSEANESTTGPATYYLNRPRW